MSKAIVRAAFELRLSTWAATQGLPLAFEAAPYTPTTGQSYLRGLLVPAPTQDPSLGAIHRRYVGDYQVSIYTPDGAGPGASQAIEAGIEALFPRGLGMTQAGHVIANERPPWPTTLVPRDGWIHTPVSIRYRLDRFS